MKTLLPILICGYFSFFSVHAAEKESVTPLLPAKFGEVIEITVKFIEKPNTYDAQILVKQKWYAKVIAVNGKVLKKPIVMEYRSGDEEFEKGSTVVLRAYEDIESYGQNREWEDGFVPQFEYGIYHFLRVRTLPEKE